jgi:branched-chain amino acid transport system substrate-binding protein
VGAMKRGKWRTLGGIRPWLLRIACSFALAGLLLCPAAQAAPATGAPIYVGLDGEFSWPGSTSAQSVERGILIAIDEINARGGVLGGRPLKLATRDNATVPARTIRNLHEFAQQPDLVAVFCGRFSPTVIDALETIHTLKMVLLDPWASADIITDHTMSPSFTFRLSLKDSYAMPALMNYGRSRGITSFGLIVLNTSWGRSNVAAAERYAARASGVTLAGVRWFNWQDQTLLDKYLDLKNQGAKAILLVANDREASILVKEIAGLDRRDRLPVLSHWGASGGQMAEMTGAAMREVDFMMLQTYSFIGDQRPRARGVLSSARRLFGTTNARSIASPAGLAHAYDLTHILARAIDAAGTTDRPAIRRALEEVRNVDGLVKRYARPFTASRHDALAESDVILTRYDADGAIVPIASRRR